MPFIPMPPCLPSPCVQRPIPSFLALLSLLHPLLASPFTVRPLQTPPPSPCLLRRAPACRRAAVLQPAIAVEVRRDPSFGGGCMLSCIGSYEESGLGCKARLCGGRRPERVGEDTSVQLLRRATLSSPARQEVHGPPLGPLLPLPRSLAGGVQGFVQLQLLPERSIRCTCMLLLREGLHTSSQWCHRPPQHIAVFLFPSNFTSSSSAFTKEAAKDLRCCPLYCMYLMILRPSGLICICDYVSIH